MLVRKEVNLVQVVENNNDDSIWIRIKKEKYEGSYDTYVGTYYMSPENNIERSRKKYDFLSTMNSEVTLFGKKGPILIPVDFNSRTGVERDFVGFDKSDLELNVQNHDNQSLRNMEDKKVNSRAQLFKKV